jgi:hypothetical protein
MGETEFDVFAEEKEESLSWPLLLLLLYSSGVVAGDEDL